MPNNIGLDLRPNDVAERFTCETGGCHDEWPQGDFSPNTGSSRDTHALKLACQACQIPIYGKGVPTEVSRDWQDPHLAAKACNGRGGWLPLEDKGSDLIPSYTWFDGTSEVYYLSEPLSGVPTPPWTRISRACSAWDSMPEIPLVSLACQRVTSPAGAPRSTR